jgi:ammonium transporter, Amt family
MPVSPKLVSSFLGQNLTIYPFPTAGDINVYDPSTGTTQVYNLGNIAWIISATALVWIMIPGVGFFYSGLLRRKNALSMIWLSMVCLATVSFQVSLHTSFNM